MDLFSWRTKIKFNRGGLKEKRKRMTQRCAEGQRFAERGERRKVLHRGH